MQLANWLSDGRKLRDDDVKDAAALLASVFSSIDIGRSGIQKSAFYIPCSLDIRHSTIFPREDVSN
jgi:hypothetical protein